jgi:hypothetical protein
MTETGATLSTEKTDIKALFFLCLGKYFVIITINVNKKAKD